MPWSTACWACGACSAGKDEGTSITSLLTALVGIVAGLVCLLAPDFATTYVVLLIGFWNIAAGLLQLIGALVMWKDIEQPGLLALAGLAGAALGLLIVFYPGHRGGEHHLGDRRHGGAGGPRAAGLRLEAARAPPRTS